MRLNFSENGSYSIDVDSVEEAAALVRKVQGKEDETRLPAPCNLNALSDQELKTYQFLVDNDCDEGVHFHAYARWAGVTDKAAQQRFYKLLMRGFLTRDGLRRGRYRARD